MKDLSNLPKGKGVFLWQPWKLGTPDLLVQRLLLAGVDFVCLKVSNGTYVWQGTSYPVGEYAAAFKAAGIRVGAWSYIYLWNGPNEAKACNSAVKMYTPEFLLVDAEGDAKNRPAAAGAFANCLDVPVPVGLCSFWKPSLHRELPWNELLKCCDFVAPQVYWRGQHPVEKLWESRAEYKKLAPKHPYPLVGGDMYKEYGTKPTPGQVREFLAACRQSKEIGGVLMWSADQMNVVPELWQAFSDFDWPLEEEPEPDEPESWEWTVTRNLREALPGWDWPDPPG
jgi:hypothetical protein